MIEGTNVVVTRVPKKPLVLPADMQDDVLQQEGVGRRLAAHRILKWFGGTNRKPRRISGRSDPTVPTQVSDFLHRRRVR